MANIIDNQSFCKNYHEAVRMEKVADDFGIFEHEFVYATCTAGVFANVCMEGLFNYREHANAELADKCNKECPYRNMKVFNIKNREISTEGVAVGYEWCEQTTKVKVLVYTNDGDREIVIDLDNNKVFIEY